MGHVKLVWVSRHSLTEKNWDILKCAFPQGVTLYQYRDTVSDVRELKEFADKVEADAYVVVLPPHLIQQLMQIDRRPIYRFVVDRKLLPDGEVIFDPVGLERIVKIEVVTERVV